jgi:hypothetical protein
MIPGLYKQQQVLFASIINYFANKLFKAAAGTILYFCGANVGITRVNYRAFN